VPLLYRHLQLSTLRQLNPTLRYMTCLSNISLLWATLCWLQLNVLSVLALYQYLYVVCP
jgi:hypothetical protein